MQPTLIVITGNSASGKTTLARLLGQANNIPYISKDEIKGRIFDGLGAKDKDWSRKLSAVSHRIMDDMAAKLLSTGHHVIVESNFKPELDSARFKTMLDANDAACIQILCKATSEVLFSRWNERIASGERHAGHVESASQDEIKGWFAAPYPALDLPGRLVEFDTTDTSDLQLPQLKL